MTDDEITIAIAENTGWNRCYENPNLRGQWMGWKFDKWGCIPGFLEDLNACHEIEDKLPENSADIYSKHLTDACLSGTRTCDFCNYPSDFTWHATARQRCEAFLRTIGKWKA